MPQIVEIPGYGEVEFPDDMADDQIAAAIKKNISPGSIKQSAPSRSFGKAMLHGLSEPIVGAAQLISAGVEKIAPENSEVAKRARARREVAEARRKEMQSEAPEGLEWGRVAGNVLATAPLGFGKAATGLLSGARSGALVGGVSGLLTPAEDKGNFWGEKGQQALLGGAAGGVGAGLLGGVSRVIKPNTRPEVQALMAEGVTPTPGQILGGGWQRTESALKSFPILGDAIKKAQTRGIEQFDEAALNRALDPIGKKVSAVGHEGMEQVRTQLSGAYQDLLPKLPVTADETFADDLNKIIQSARGLPEAQAKQLSGVFQNEVGRRFSAGKMSGEAMKEADSELGRLAAGYKSDPAFANRELGTRLEDTGKALRGLVNRNHPEFAPDLDKLDFGWANLARLQRAATYPGTEKGLFTPSHLARAATAGDKTMRKGASSEGKALLQDLAESGKDVLSKEVPDSGTPYRMAVNALAGGGSLALDPTILGTTLALSGLYTKPGTEAMAALLAKRPELAGPLAQHIRRLGAPTAVALPSMMQGLLE